MPCTEKSAARAGDTVSPYPFCDKLEYVAGDYKKYCSGKKLEKKHSAFMKLLEEWAQSDSACSNKKIKSVYSYVKKGTLGEDLLKSKSVAEICTPADIETHNFFIRWEVEISGDNKPQTWDDSEIQQLWIDFYSNHFSNKKGFCYVSGKTEPIAELHPKKIRTSGDSAKLISSNDDHNYTFRGRFLDADQACQVGMAVSVKAHSALRWLIEKQGVVYYTGEGIKKKPSLTIVAWCSASDVEPQLLKSTNALGWDEDDEEKYTPGESSANAIKNRLRGYYGKIPEDDKILIMGLNAATTGRMSILLYREFIKSDFCEAQENWHEHLAWFYTYWKKDQNVPYHTISAPSPVEIAKAAYGGHLSDNVKVMTIQRLLPCIIDKSPIPFDIERLCFDRASRLETISKNEREKTLETACAVIRYNLYMRNKEKKEDYKVGLEEDRKNRDYLYGRLLAVADRVESLVLHGRGETRDTNAVRYMQRFAKYPCSTWEFLYVEKLQPYFSQLKNRGQFEALIQKISGLFDHDEFVSDKALSGEFLLGYHCQQKAFWESKAKLKAVKQSKPINDEKDD
ncbi:hypothetical protein AGMMS50229_17630 [Campylobacterota bacterium]|nr:hypothetical protein AGMMS50229_17630 [Campylobacterota bacterium]